MKVNPKPCKQCGDDFTPRFKTTERFCSYKCQTLDVKSKPQKQRVRISPVSNKRKVQNAVYKAKRIKFLQDPKNKFCPVTQKQATEIHHTRSGSDRSKYYLDETTWIAVSREGHIWIHANPIQARKKGLLI